VRGAWRRTATRPKLEVGWDRGWLGAQCEGAAAAWGVGLQAVHVRVAAAHTKDQASRTSVSCGKDSLRGAVGKVN
jgi:hypothetical protein